MKKITLCLLLMMTALAARAQSLANTSWRAYDLSNNTPGLFWRFSADTVYVSSNDVSYTPVSTYATNTNTFLITDLSPVLCGANYTAAYTFTIIVDSLMFGYVNDTCSVRYTNILANYFLRNTTGIEDLNPVSAANIYPNPSADGVFNLKFSDYNNLPKRIYVLSTDGRKIIEETFSSNATNHAINLHSCASGIYFIVMENDLGRRVAKLVR